MFTNPTVYCIVLMALIEYQCTYVLNKQIHFATYTRQIRSMHRTELTPAIVCRE